MDVAFAPGRGRTTCSSCRAAVGEAQGPFRSRARPSGAAGQWGVLGDLLVGQRAVAKVGLAFQRSQGWRDCRHRGVVGGWGVLEVGDGAEALQREQRLWAPDVGPAVAQMIGVQGSVTTRKDAQCFLSFHVTCWLECVHGFGQMLSGAHG